MQQDLPGKEAPGKDPGNLRHDPVVDHLVRTLASAFPLLDQESADFSGHCLIGIKADTNGHLTNDRRSAFAKVKFEDGAGSGFYVSVTAPDSWNCPTSRYGTYQACNPSSFEIAAHGNDEIHVLLRGMIWAASKIAWQLKGAVPEDGRGTEYVRVPKGSP